MKKQFSVLLVDDEPMIVKSVGRYLQTRNCRITACHDGMTALRMAGQHRFDAVIADFDLPHLDGLTLLQHIATAMPDCRLVMTSGSHTPGNMPETAIPESIAFIPKPFELDSLLAMIGC